MIVVTIKFQLIFCVIFVCNKRWTIQKKSCQCLFVLLCQFIVVWNKIIDYLFITIGLILWQSMPVSAGNKSGRVLCSSINALKSIRIEVNMSACMIATDFKKSNTPNEKQKQKHLYYQTVYVYPFASARMSQFAHLTKLTSNQWNKTKRQKKKKKKK